jgi:imidazolonepropionase-like amidohydrolase
LTALHAVLACRLLVPVLVHVQAGGELTLVEHVTVIDVERARALPERIVSVRGERIHALAEGTPERPDGARVIDGTGLFLVPGLTDAHVHYVAAPDVYGPLLVANGVTLVRDTGSETQAILALRGELARGERLGPELLCTGAIVDGDPPVWPFSEACDGPEAARAAVRRLHTAGVDQIKVYSRLERATHAAAIDEAHALGLKAVGHVPLGLSLMDALRAGQNGVEHLSGFELLIAENAPPIELPAAAGEWSSFAHWFSYPAADAEALRAAYREIAAAGMVHCPTLVVMAGIAQAADPSLRDPERLRYVPAYLRAFWEGEAYVGFGRWTRQALPHMQAAVRELHNAGVKLVTGTDLTNPYVYAGSSLHDELRLFQEAGIPAADALRAATLAPAEYLGVAERLGTLAPGKTASMFLVQANPLEDVRHAAEIEGVFLRGRYFDRAELDALLAGVREQTDRAETEVPPPAAEEPSPEGELVAAGRLKVSFAGFDAGHEEFRIVRTADGYAFSAVHRPRNSPEQPFALDVAYDPARSFRSAAYRELVERPLEASYRLDGARFFAHARRGEEEHAPETLDMAPDARIDPPVFSAGFFTLDALGLSVGETLSCTAIEFGRPDWRPQASPMIVERHADTVLDLGDARRLVVRHYSAVYETPVGELALAAWTDERGVVVRAELAFPMGKIEARLE